MKTTTKRKAKKSDGLKPAMPKEPIAFDIADLQVRLALDMDRFSTGSLSMTIADTMTTIVSEGKSKPRTLGHVAGCIGGGVEIAVGKRRWRLSPLDLWKAVAKADENYRKAALRGDFVT